LVGKFHTSQLKELGRMGYSSLPEKIPAFAEIGKTLYFIGYIMFLGPMA
jgi:hypothetical protein